MSKEERYYVGPPTDCDICRDKITDVFYDCATVMGPWGNLCPDCFERYSYGLGTGRGQKYNKQGNGRWLKTAG